MRRTALAPFVLVSLALLSTSASAAADVRTYYHAGPEGVVEIREVGPAGQPVIESGLDATGPRTGIEMIWQRHLSDATFTTASLGAPAGLLAAATYLNPPKELGVYAIEGDGTPDWTYAGTELYLSSSRDGSCSRRSNSRHFCMTGVSHSENPPMI